MKGVGWLAIPVLSLTLFTLGTSAQTPDQRGITPLSIVPVVFTFVAPRSQSGGTVVHISQHGNIVKFESPFGYEHIGVGTLSEGYVLCYVNPFTGAFVNAFDLASFEAGFGAAEITPPNTITRATLDGVLKLSQRFFFEGLQKSLRIEMCVTNESIDTLDVPGVILRRQVDFDADTGGSLGWADFMNRHAADSRDGVWAWNDKLDPGPRVPGSPGGGRDAHTIALRHLFKDASIDVHEAKVTELILDNTCTPHHHDTRAEGYARHDHGDTIQYGIGKLGARSITVIVKYMRY